MHFIYAVIPISLACAVWSGRVVLLLSRGGSFSEHAAKQDVLSLIMGAVILPIQILLLVLGFLVFQWWVWLILIAIIILPVSALVTRASFSLFYQLKTLLDLIAIGGTAFAYASYFELI